ncbi:TPR repeat region-containing protein [Glycomyces terrestris]|uniref:TPR repeat domain-containing protein n=1 Tax=Glycomyces terrestris TaxID=2493553 RepID=A0A426V0X5_9ACTN|nr:hypothetical protein [Glycomyces terrestris]RRS00496.1 hypothetical protein EIW28_08010 [Glycomyces terrestris]
MPSIPTLGSLNIPVSNAVVDTLRELATELDAKSGSIIGRGADVMEQMNSTAVEFSELVAEPLRRRGAESIEAARKAMQGSVWGSTVTGRWADDAETYQKLAAKYQGLWAEQVANDFGVTAESAGVTAGMPGDVQSKVMDNAIADAGAGALANFQGIVNAAYEQYKRDAKTAGSRLKAGPTPANLKSLAAGGGGTWAMFNLFGAAAGVPPLTGADGKAFAEWLREFINEDEALPADKRKMLEALLALAGEARDKQQDGGTLTTGQLDFLEQFFKGMDQPWTAQNPIQTSVLYLIPDILDGSKTPEADRALIMAAMGGGLLALSDPRIGGGGSRMPQSMKTLVDHFFGTGDRPPYSRETAAELRGLGEFFSAMKGRGLDDLEGGREYSAALTLAVADADSSFRIGSEDRLLDVLEVSTRSRDANAALLTGVLQHPDYGKDSPEHVLRGLFGPQWKDDGKAASGLIDWIGDDASSKDPAVRDRAVESAYALFTTMTNEKPASHWDQSAYDFFTDSYGKIGSFENAPIGQANPEIAFAMGKTAAAYLDYFSAADNGGDDQATFGNPASQMYLSMDTRRNFIEMIMGSPDAGEKFGQAAYAHALAEAAYADGWKDPEEAQSQANESGMLMGLLDHGFNKVFTEAQTDADRATALATQHSNWSRAGAAAAKELILELPGTRSLGRLGQQGVRQLTEFFKWTPGVAQSHDFIWDKGVTPDPADYKQTWDRSKEQWDLAVNHAVVQQALKDPDSGITIADVQKADPRLVEGGRLRPVEEILAANEPPVKGSVDKNLDHRLATEELHRLFGDKLSDKLKTYLSTFDDQRKDQ